MIKIRKGTFETNSSSTHSVSIHSKKPILQSSELIVEDDGYIHVNFDEFGWGLYSYFDQYTKLSYAVTLIGTSERFNKYFSEEISDEEVESFYNLKEFKELSDSIASYTGAKGIKVDSFKGYIDHQSLTSLDIFLSENNLDNIIDFIFSDDVELLIDDDNH